MALKTKAADVLRGDLKVFSEVKTFKKEQVRQKHEEFVQFLNGYFREMDAAESPEARKQVFEKYYLLRHGEPWGYDR